mmetsp:Transcript_21388/g.32314  ORF Transcript_21388/g.32314 Transcript_21388/m.32314 type:complete len:204 (-) Transcript_21388:145-756(-)|eukprot:CAMPEP_0178897916 /NCGR_PEP_ID=MMETSP0786-20121207/2025_1 /TAXON_ID=186022 /ORGANISM="Thalassionema frauenfeldii, Strain CCMP 1798" /LENGTH=203 /DNA_ID=CAMNT_0020568545 /DNA_START=2365 /DNA_END=2976 /DNA_ORIENTATION=-
MNPDINNYATTPHTLCGNRELFSDYQPYNQPYNQPHKILLGDETTQIHVLGSRTINIIINKDRVLLPAEFSNECPTILLSAAAHSKYKSCTATRSNQAIKVFFPTFNVSANDRFKTTVCPGKNSSLPIHWSHLDSPLATPTLNDVQLKLLHPKAIVPSRATTDSTGYDIYTINQIKLQPGQISKIPTGLAIKIPPNTDCQIRP